MDLDSGIVGGVAGLSDGDVYSASLLHVGNTHICWCPLAAPTGIHHHETHSHSCMSYK